MAIEVCITANPKSYIPAWVEDAILNRTIDYLLINGKVVWSKKEGDIEHLYKTQNVPRTGADVV